VHTNTAPITITGEKVRSVTWSGEAVTTFYFKGAKGDLHMTFAYSDALDAHSVLTVNLNGLNLGTDLKCRVRQSDDFAWGVSSCHMTSNGNV